MKKLLTCLSLALCVITSCKKDTARKSTPTAAQVAAIQAKLTGVWSVAGIPGTTLYPYSGSLVFDSQSNLTLTDFADSKTNATYTLTGNGQTYIINAKTAGGFWTGQILLLSADTLKIQTLTNDASAVNQVFVRANANEVKNKIFKINILPFSGNDIAYALNVGIKIYLTPKNGIESLVLNQNVTQAYTYQYSPAPGDHIRIAITNTAQPGNPPVLTCLATYKGVPIGKDWQSASFSSLPEKSWDIND